MAEITCEQVQQSAAEFALGIAPVEERAAVASHVLRCPECRSEVESLTSVASRLFDLVPGTEPPLGFDRRVLHQVTGHGRDRRRWPTVAKAAVAVALLIFGTLGWLTGHGPSHPPPHTQLVGNFSQSGRIIGQVAVYGDGSPWVSMTVRGSGSSGRVTCQLVYQDGYVATLGSFDLVGGNGTWSAPDTAGTSGITAARLVDSHNHVVAVADFTRPRAE